MKVLSVFFLCFALHGTIGSPSQRHKLIGQNHCTWGPSYWCQHIDAAKECQAINHCVNVWKNNRLSQQVLKSETCTFCQAMVDDLRIVISNGKTKEEIKFLAQAACSLVPNPALSSLCKLAITNYLPELITMLEQHLNSSQICSALGVCADFSTSQRLTKLPLLALPQIKLPAMAYKQSTSLLSKSAANCEECKLVVAELQSLVKSNATVAQVEQIVKTYLCAQLGELKATCESYVDIYLPEVFQLLSQELDPTSICQMIGFCNQKKNNLLKVDKARSAFLKITFSRQLLNPLLKSPAECEICELVVTEARSMLQSNQTQTEIENFLRDRLCNHLGQFKEQCQSYVTQFAPLIFELVSSELNPTVVCQALGACGNNVRVTKIKKFKRPAIIQKTKVAAGPNCILCEYAMKYLESQLVLNSTQVAIEKAVQKVCLVLPSTVRQDCNTFIQQYEPVIIKLLVAQISPSQLCAALGLCVQPKSVSGPQCILCEYLIETLDRQLINNKTESQIEAALLQVCTILPSTIRAECDSFVGEYGPAVIQLLLAQISPQRVCTLLGLCSSNRSFNSRQTASTQLLFHPGPLAKLHRVALKRPITVNPETCQICQVVLQYVESLLKENATIQQIENVLEKVCNFLPTADKQACDAIVETYTAQIVQLIVAEVNPQQICQYLGLCSAARIIPDGRVHLIKNKLPRSLRRIIF